MHEKRPQRPQRTRLATVPGQPRLEAHADGVSLSQESPRSIRTLATSLPMSLAIRFSAAVVSGVMIFLAFPKFDIWPVAWVAFIPLMAAIEDQRPKTAFFYGLVTGLVANLGGFYWIHGLLVVFGHMHPAMAAPLYILLCIYQGALVALWAWACRHIEPATPGKRALARVALFVTAEFLVPFIFPWVMGNSQYLFHPVVQIADIVGVFGISALIMLVNSAVYETIYALLKPERPLPAILMAGTAALLAATLSYGLLRIDAIDAKAAKAPKLKVGIVEGNVGIREKEDPEHVAANLLIHQRLSQKLERAGAELIVWPESAYDTRWIRRSMDTIAPSDAPLHPDPRWDALSVDEKGRLRVPQPLPVPVDLALDKAEGIPWRAQTSPQRGFHTPLLFGAITYEPDPAPPAPGRRWARRIYNSALLIDEHGRFGSRIYDKNYRLVFGEYIPFGRTFPWLYDLIPEAASFSKGETVTTLNLGRARIGPLVCYEGILPRFTRRVAQQNPNLLINITNDAWFGKTSEPYLHLALTTLRSIENRLALVRSTNTGVSAFIDPAGRITASTDIYAAEALLQEVPLMEGTTIYREVGDLFAWLCVLASVFILIKTRYRRWGIREH